MGKFGGFPGGFSFFSSGFPGQGQSSSGGRSGGRTGGRTRFTSSGGGANPFADIFKHFGGM